MQSRVEGGKLHHSRGLQTDVRLQLRGRNVEARKTNYVAVVGENSEPSVSSPVPSAVPSPNVFKMPNALAVENGKTPLSTGNHPLSIN